MPGLIGKGCNCYWGKPKHGNDGIYSRACDISSTFNCAHCGAPLLGRSGQEASQAESEGASGNPPQQFGKSPHRQGAA